jgi:hypothetical protein
MRSGCQSMATPPSSGCLAPIRVPGSMDSHAHQRSGSLVTRRPRSAIAASRCTRYPGRLFVTTTGSVAAVGRLDPAMRGSAGPMCGAQREGRRDYRITACLRLDQDDTETAT